MSTSMKLMRSAYFFTVICATVLATEAYFDYQHGKLHQLGFESPIDRK